MDSTSKTTTSSRNGTYKRLFAPDRGLSQLEHRVAQQRRNHALRVIGLSLLCIASTLFWSSIDRLTWPVAVQLSTWVHNLAGNEFAKVHQYGVFAICGLTVLAYVLSHKYCTSRCHTLYWRALGEEDIWD